MSWTTWAMIGIGLGLLSALAVWFWRQQRRQQQQELLTGVRLIQAMRTLLAHFQQHRGFSTGLLNGDLSLAGELEKLQGAIRRDIQELLAIDSWLTGNERWQGMADHWQRLQGSYRQLEAEQNLLQHNRLITNLLYLMEDTGEWFGLTTLAQVDSEQMRRIWRDLLQAAENIGQARALGTGVAAAGRCSSVARIRLSYLRGRIQLALESSLQHVNASGDDRAQVQAFLRLIDEQLLVERVSISPKDYFQQATQVLERLYALFDQEMDGLRSRLS
ncbi:nitrate- and nitrite sensing domain-containing protein [Pokkaliibacter sp. MBI-7]|uniref:nitrate- and nitrite sensing domain-containing protein n=1 Tax=Pokkaliibacter sp. MBI-7 TaxID=3040600 RepID=UPI00244C8502|nr:nitrate- and nitrite sensing domain-containing protein [Pokkaliibacter sp. MBI-7]MDH2433978.1 nitrate- and nitrite sensing domain-containing protein [Pokkaliibacter sp. MBI-7]